MTYEGTGPFFPDHASFGDGSNGLIKTTTPSSVDHNSASVGTSGAVYLLPAGDAPISIGSLDTTGRDEGWNMQAGNTNAADGVSKRRIPAGTWVFADMPIKTGGTGLSTGSFTMRINLFKRNSSTGALFFIASGNGTVTYATSSYRAVTVNVVAPEIILAVDETIHYEEQVQCPATTFGTYTIQGHSGSYTMDLETMDPNITPPSPGLRYVYARTQTDSAPATDGGSARKLFFPRALGQTVLGVDALDRKNGIFRRQLAETISASESLARKYQAVRGLLETITAVDSLARQLFVSRSMTESIPTTETLAASFQGNRTITESLSSITDSAGRKFVGARALTETVAGVDTSLGRKIVFKRGLTETTVVSDALGRRTVITRGNTESVPTTETLFRQLNYVRAVQEDIGLTGGGLPPVIKRPLFLVFED